MEIKYSVLFVLCLFLFVSIAESQEIQKIFTLRIVVYRNDFVEMKEFEISEGKTSTFLNVNAEYTIRMLAFNDSVIFQQPLSIDFVAYPLSHNNTTEVQLDDRELYLRLPFFQHARKIEIAHGDKIIFELELKDYLCNRDDLCYDNEDEINCPEDCFRKSPVPWTYIIVISSAVFVVVTVIILRYFNFITSSRK